jgi:hypothetical protein
MKDSVSFTLTMTFLLELIGETPCEVAASFGVVILALLFLTATAITFASPQAAPAAYPQP